MRPGQLVEYRAGTALADEVLFDGVEELDAVGLWEVLKVVVEGLEGERVLTVAEKAEPMPKPAPITILR